MNRSASDSVTPRADRLVANRGVLDIAEFMRRQLVGEAVAELRAATPLAVTTPTTASGAPRRRL